MIGLPSTELDDLSKKVLDIVRPGSVILFTRNILNREQVTNYITDISEFLGYKPLIAIDQEGGIVTRLTEGFSISPGSMALTSTGNPDYAYEAGKILGEEMKSVGVDWNLAPVVDINNNTQNPAIGVRSFSDNADTVIEYASRFIEGQKASGIITCLKHFPGNGRVITDPHLDMPVLDIPKDEIYRTELAPFRAINAPSWMPTHIYVPGIQTSKEPITVSKEVLTDMIRNEFKYQGVLLADDLNMGGVSNLCPPEELALKTLEAGMDMLSFCFDDEKQISVRKFLNKEIRNDKLAVRITQAVIRIDALFSQREDSKPFEETNPDFTKNEIIINEISSKSVHIIKNKSKLIPIEMTDNIFAVSATRLVLVEDNEKGIPEVVTQTSNLLKCPVTIYDREISKQKSASMLQIAENKLNIIFTENAHLITSQTMFIEELSKISRNLVLIALRNPYDTDITGIVNAICSNGYNKSQQLEVLKKLIL